MDTQLHLQTTEREGSKSQIIIWLLLFLNSDTVWVKKGSSFDGD